jgi:hypothetical protein
MFISFGYNNSSGYIVLSPWTPHCVTTRCLSSSYAVSHILDWSQHPHLCGKCATFPLDSVRGTTAAILFTIVSVEAD